MQLLSNSELSWLWHLDLKIIVAEVKLKKTSKNVNVAEVDRCTEIVKGINKHKAMCSKKFYLRSDTSWLEINAIN